jgi:signal transduction histidine kinase
VNPSPAAQSASKKARTNTQADDELYRALRSAVFSTLRSQEGDLVARWEGQIKSVAFIDPRDSIHESGHGVTSALASLMIGVLTSEDAESDEAIVHGLQFGIDSFARGVSLHQAMKALDLLAAMTLYAAEIAIDDTDVSTNASAAHGVRLARQLQRRAALLSLATTRGYTQAYAEALRERFRLLRHDLRNPLGTIRNVLALMDDESVPLAARDDPKFQAMASRNARSLEELIADRLSDAAALLPVVASQDISLREIASCVCRELRADTERKGVTILVSADAPQGRLDSPGLELLLRSALEAIVQECVPGEQLSLEFSDSAADQATVTVSSKLGRSLLEDTVARERVTRLARQIGATFVAGERVLLSVPLDAANHEDQLPRIHSGDERALMFEPVRLGDRETRDDLGGLH